jgi:predicted HicB family RNase H-like nuclease
MKAKKSKKVERLMNVKISEDLHAKVLAHTEREGGKVKTFVARAIETRLASLSVADKTRSAAG